MRPRIQVCIGDPSVGSLHLGFRDSSWQGLGDHTHLWAYCSRRYDRQTEWFLCFFIKGLLYLEEIPHKLRVPLFHILGELMPSCPYQGPGRWEYLARSLSPPE